MDTKMAQHSEWYHELEIAGFKRIRDEFGNVEYQYPKRKDYRVGFDWGTLKVIHNHQVVFETRSLDLGTIDAVIHAIKWPKTSSGILKNKK